MTSIGQTDSRMQEFLSGKNRYLPGKDHSEEADVNKDGLSLEEGWKFLCHSGQVNRERLFTFLEVSHKRDPQHKTVNSCLNKFLQEELPVIKKGLRSKSPRTRLKSFSKFERIAAMGILSTDALMELTPDAIAAHLANLSSPMPLLRAQSMLVFNGLIKKGFLKGQENSPTYKKVVQKNQKLLGLKGNSAPLNEDSQKHLIGNLPAKQRERAFKLLQQRIYPCKTSKEQARLPENCFATVAKVLFDITRKEGEDELEAQVVDADLEKLAKANGYNKVATFSPYKVRQEVLLGLDNRNINQALRKLKPSDMLLFGPAVHGAVYLGTKAGEHYMMQKENTVCGEKSPYEIVTVRSYLEGEIQKTVGYTNEDMYVFASVWIYRKK